MVRDEGKKVIAWECLGRMVSQFHAHYAAEPLSESGAMNIIYQYIQ